MIVLAVFTGNCGKKSVPAANKEADMVAQKYIPVTVIDFSGLDGCGFLLVKSGGEKLQPVSLPDSLMKNELKLWIKFIAEEGVGICMAGPMIRIVDAKTKVE